MDEFIERQALEIIEDVLDFGALAMAGWNGQQQAANKEYGSCNEKSGSVVHCASQFLFRWLQFDDSRIETGRPGKRT